MEGNTYDTCNTVSERGTTGLWKYVRCLHNCIIYAIRGLYADLDISSGFRLIVFLTPPNWPFLYGGCSFKTSQWEMEDVMSYVRFSSALVQPLSSFLLFTVNTSLHVWYLTSWPLKKKLLAWRAQRLHEDGKPTLHKTCSWQLFYPYSMVPSLEMSPWPYFTWSQLPWGPHCSSLLWQKHTLNVQCQWLICSVLTVRVGFQQTVM